MNIDSHGALAKEQFSAMEELGFEKCEFGPDEDECENCHKPNLQLYFAGPPDAGRYCCVACVTAEHLLNHQQETQVAKVIEVFKG